MLSSVLSSTFTYRKSDSSLHNPCKTRSKVCTIWTFCPMPEIVVIRVQLLTMYMERSGFIKVYPKYVCEKWYLPYTPCCKCWNQMSFDVGNIASCVATRECVRKCCRRDSKIYTYSSSLLQLLSHNRVFGTSLPELDIGWWTAGLRFFVQQPQERGKDCYKFHKLKPTIVNKLSVFTTSLSPKGKRNQRGRVKGTHEQVCTTVSWRSTFKRGDFACLYLPFTKVRVCAWHIRFWVWVKIHSALGTSTYSHGM